MTTSGSQIVPSPSAGPASAVRNEASAIGDFARLLSPRLRAVANRIRRQDRSDRIQIAAVTVLGLAFGVTIFFLFRRALIFLRSAEVLGAVLTYKLLGMLFVVFFSILLFSNIVSALSTFFLSRELDRLVAAPVAARRFFYARFTEVLVESSWMVLLFSIPAFLAYGVVHSAGPAFYVMTALTLPPFLVIPAALGVLLTTLLVTAFPAQRTKEILVFLSLVAVGVLVLAARLLQPERLLRPEGFSDFQAFLNAMQTPDSDFFPSTWATQVLAPLVGLRGDSPMFYWLLLASSAAVSTMVAESIMGRLFLRTWSRAQEGRQARLTQQPLWEKGLDLVTRPFPSQMRLLMAKEVKTFFRDTSQWSQLILLGALVVLHVYNFSVLPSAWKALLASRFGTGLLTVLFLLNMTLAAFITAAVAVRFVYPSISLEGRAFWILKTCPVTLRQVWWTKFWVNLVPLLILSQILVIATNVYLRVNPFTMWLSAGTLFLIVFAVVALGLAVGATYPRFEAENAAKVAASMGGLVYMILSMSFIFAVMLLQAWPVYLGVVHGGRLGVISLRSLSVMLFLFGCVATLSIAVFIGSVRYGIRRLENI